MTRTLIYIIAAFALWLYFKYGTFTAKTDKSRKPGTYGGSEYSTVNPFSEKARPGYGGEGMV